MQSTAPPTKTVSPPTLRFLFVSKGKIAEKIHVPNTSVIRLQPPVHTISFQAYEDSKDQKKRSGFERKKKRSQRKGKGQHVVPLVKCHQVITNSHFPNIFDGGHTANRQRSRPSPITPYPFVFHYPHRRHSSESSAFSLLRGLRSST